MHQNLTYLLENNLTINCPLQSTDKFVSWCEERGIETSEDRLEALERWKLLFPVARAPSPVENLRVTRHGGRKHLSGSFGEKEPGEEYEEHYAQRLAYRNLVAGQAWDPREREFEPWDSFRVGDDADYRGRRCESFYSNFQSYTLHGWLTRSLTLPVPFDILADITDDKAVEVIGRWRKDARETLEVAAEPGTIPFLRQDVAWVCQVISNRYFPQTQTDRRTYIVGGDARYEGRIWVDGGWRRYCRKFDAKAVLANLGLQAHDIAKMHEELVSDIAYVDPLRKWYDFMRFVALARRNELRGEALLVETWYAMEHMLRLFYADLTGAKLAEPTMLLDSFLGDGVREDNLKCLEYLANDFHVNPRPKLVLVVEGEGEEIEIPRLYEAITGAKLSTRMIALRCLHGVAGFSGRKEERHGAMVKLVDEYRGLQTIVFFILDREGRAAEVKKQLITARSQHAPETVTKDDFIRLWDRCIEFDNFTDAEIAAAMTLIAKGAASFTAKEVALCRARFFYYARQPPNGRPPDPRHHMDHLEKLFRRKLQIQRVAMLLSRVAADRNGTPAPNILAKRRGFPKVELLRLLFDSIHAELRTGVVSKQRPIIAILYSMDELASLNHQPVREESRQLNQTGGYLGNALPTPPKREF